ncbi:MAG: WD40 repeat domain-containing protein [Phaeodactylibacter sp.]|nr:WD40 repeat domain-containing protein [Phaeodactylibacter sp.]
MLNLLLFGGFQMNHLSAQQDCYYRFLQEGIEAYRNFDFEAARKKFSAAKICPDIPNNDDLDIWFERLRSGYQEVLKEFKEETDSILLVLDSLRTKSRAIENQIAISDSEMFLNNAKNKDLPIEERAFLGLMGLEFYSKTNEELINDEYLNTIFNLLFQGAENFNTLLPSFFGQWNSLIVDEEMLYIAGINGSIGKINLSKLPEKTQPLNDLISIEPYSIKSLSISHDHNILAVGGESPYLYLLNLKKWGITDSLILHETHPIWNVAFHPKEMILYSTGNDGNLRFLDLRKNSFINGKLLSNVQYPGKLGISPSGNLLGVLYGNNSFKYINLLRNDVREIIGPKGDKITSFAFLQDDKKIIFGTQNGYLIIYDVIQKQSLFQRIHHLGVKEIKVVENNSFVLTIGYDRKIVLTDITNLKIALSIDISPDVWSQTNNDWPICLDYDLKEKNIYVGYGNGSIRVWPLNNKKIREMLCEKIGNNNFESFWKSRIGAKIDFYNPCSEIK